MLSFILTFSPDEYQSKSFEKANYCENQGWGVGAGVPKPLDLAGAGAESAAILIFLQEPVREPEHFKHWNGARAGIN